MAKQVDTEVVAEPAKPRRSKKQLLIIAGIAVLMLAVGGGGAWLLTGKKSETHTADAPDAVKPKPKPKLKPSAPPVFVTLDPFVVNLAGDVQHYLQVGIDLRVAESSVSDQIKVHLPEIRNGVLLLLSSKAVEDLASIEQKNALRAQIREVVNKPLGIHTPAPKNGAVPAAEPAEQGGEAHAADAEEPLEFEEDTGVVEVLLTSFVIQ
jgi:flagellar protein FliL